MDVIQVRHEISTGVRLYLVAHAHPPSAGQFPWGEQAFDAFVAIIDRTGEPDDYMRHLALELVSLPTEWIETMGHGAERLHDFVDEASVAIGRQAKVGDGNPMTAWYEARVARDEMVGYVVLGGLGACEENKLIVIAGPEAGAVNFVNSLKKKILEADE